MAVAMSAGLVAGGGLQKGVCLTLWNESVDSGQLNASMDALKALGADSVSVNVWWFQDNINSDVIAPDFGRYSANDDTVRAVIDAAHQRSMRVVLKPLIDLRLDPSHWRGQIVGDAAWFTGPDGYGNFANHWADIAAQKNVEILCVGTELSSTAGQESYWRGVISGVRARFAGSLAYAANHGWPATSEPVAWWDALDYIGLDAYYGLTGSYSPSVPDLRAAWGVRAALIQSWQQSLPTEDRKPILFTEVGYRSWDGANIAPWDGSSKGSSGIDQQEQADCYRALMAQLWNEPWLDGLYWWNWEINPDPPELANNWYPMQNKLAEDVLREFYSPEPCSALIMGCAMVGLLRRGNNTTRAVGCAVIRCGNKGTCGNRGT